MKTEKKLLTGTLLALCTALLVLCSVLAIGWSKAAKTGDALPEVRNNGTAIQWKYSDEADWHDLVALTELRGAAGENGTDGKNGKDGSDGKNGINGTNGKDGINGSDGKDGINGVDGKDGINAKSIEVQRAETHIQWRYEGDEWQDLVAIADITGPPRQKGPQKVRRRQKDSFPAQLASAHSGFLRCVSVPLRERRRDGLPSFLRCLRKNSTVLLF